MKHQHGKPSRLAPGHALTGDDLAGAGGGFVQWASAAARAPERPPFGQETEITSDHLKHHQWTPNSDQWSIAERGRQDVRDADSPIIQGPAHDTSTLLTILLGR